MLRLRSISYTVLLLCSFLSASCQVSFEKEWNEVDTLTKAGKPKSTIQILERIYEQSSKSDQTNDSYKALLMLSANKKGIGEQEFHTLLQKVEQEADKSPFPLKQILHSTVAELYWDYYSNNMWEILGRSETANYNNDSINTWTADQFIAKAIEQFNLSLSEKEKLQSISAFTIKEITVNNLNEDQSLYSFLSLQAFDFYSNKRSSILRARDQDQLTGEVYFAPAEEFSKAELPLNDTLSFTYNALRVIQEVLKEDKDSYSALKADLLRLHFVYKNTTEDNKDELMLKALNNCLNQYTSDKSQALVKYYIADLYYKQGKTDYQQHRFAYAKAISVCQEIKQKYRSTIAAKKCERLIEHIKHPIFSVKAEETISPDNPFALKVDYKNISSLYYKVAKISQSESKSIYNNINREERAQHYLSVAETIKEGKITIPRAGDFREHSADYIVDGIPLGHYIIISDTTKDFNSPMISYTSINVSNIFMSTRESKDYTDIFVHNRQTGKPLKGVSATIKKEENKTEKTFKGISDKNGRIRFSNKEYNGYKPGTIWKGDDTLYNSNYLYISSWSRYKPHTYKMALFTDRAIYSPGQTVYFKTLTWEGKENNLRTAANKKVYITLKDPNGNAVERHALTTNEYGSTSGTFVLPQNNLNGKYHIYLEGEEKGSTYKSIKVEEYKRPQFEIQFDKFDGIYRLGDSVTITGRAISYSGAPLGGTKGNYKIKRSNPNRLYRAGTLIDNGEISLTEDGSFTITFKAANDPQSKSKISKFFQFNIDVYITDITGETQNQKTSINIGEQTLRAYITIDDELLKTKENYCKIDSKNLNGNPADCKGKITVTKLISKAKPERSSIFNRLSDTAFYSEKEWAKIFPKNAYYNPAPLQNEKVTVLSFDTKKDRTVNLTGIENWEPGKYQFKLETFDHYGDTVTYTKTITVYGSALKKIPHPTFLKTKLMSEKVQAGENAVLYIMSSEAVTVYVEAETNSNVIYSQTVKLNNSIKKITIPVTKSEVGGFFIRASTILNDRYYEKQHQIEVPFTDKELHVSFETFRPVTLPGSKEQWKIKIQGANKEAYIAEMLACLYDKSLDAFTKNKWSLTPYNKNRSGISWDYHQKTSYNISTYRDYSYFSTEYPTTARLNKYGFQYNFHFRAAGRGVARARNGAAYKMSLNDDVEEEEEADLEISANYNFSHDMNTSYMYGDISYNLEEKSSGQINLEGGLSGKQLIGDISLSLNNFNEIKVRKNFNETAFFYPHLTSDKNGVVTITFTMPESVTKWKMMGLAHTKDMKFGFTENEIITQKKLMVQPYTPRFVRISDSLVFTAKVSNLTEESMDCKTNIQFFDALTMQPITALLKDENTKIVAIKPHQSTVVTWNLKIGKDVQAITYRITAQAGNHTDGEENTIPVLSNKKLVTETLPLYINKKGKKQYTFTSLKTNSSPTLEHHRYTLEYTSNPTWYTVQALPYLIEFPYECAEQTFSRYYANSISEHIVISNPKIQDVFKQWKNAKTSDAFISNLEKNKELKSILIEETPWLRDAESEATQKKRIAMLFDLNMMAQNKQVALNKLMQMQLDNGAWPWFKGGEPSRFTTQHIMCLTGKLKKLGIAADNLLITNKKKSLDYLSSKIKEDYDWVKKHVKDDNIHKQQISALHIHYLYMLSFYDDYTYPEECKEAVEYYTKQAEKFWLSFRMYERAMISVAARRNGNNQFAQKIIESIKEFAIEDDEMGMYFKQDNGWFWYNMPIETQTMVIEAFHEANDTESINKLKTWLLKQKQSQNWKTTKATAEAIYAILLRGGDWLSSSEQVEIMVGSENVSQKTAGNIEAGTGYIKTNWEQDKITKEMSEITLASKQDQPSWGSMYWQYFEELDKIKGHSSPLKLEKELFVETMTDKGSVITPIDKVDKLETGDIIVVRIVLTADRKMEYLHMKDMRAAGLEPINVFSRYKWQGGIGYYESTKDAATHFFIENLDKGTYVFEYKLKASQKGDFSNGITTIQSMYAPEFNSHSKGVRLKIE